MKRNLFKILIICMFIFGLSLVVSAQNNLKKIEFAKGATSTVVSGTGKQKYVINIGNNQDVTMKIISKGNKATCSIWDEEMDMSEGTDGRSFNGHFENGGDYRIEISAPKGLAFKLTIIIK